MCTKRIASYKTQGFGLREGLLSTSISQEPRNLRLHGGVSIWFQTRTNSTSVQRYKFNSRSQLLGEPLATYVAELQKLSEHCDYGDKLDEILCDCLVCGISDSCCPQQLLAETELSFHKAFKMAQSMELVERDARQLKHPQPTPSLLIQKMENQPHTIKKTTQGKPYYYAVVAYIMLVSVVSSMLPVIIVARRVTSPKCATVSLPLSRHNHVSKHQYIQQKP